MQHLKIVVVICHKMIKVGRML